MLGVEGETTVDYIEATTSKLKAVLQGWNVVAFSQLERAIASTSRRTLGMDWAEDAEISECW